MAIIQRKKISRTLVNSIGLVTLSGEKDQAITKKQTINTSLQNSSSGISNPLFNSIISNNSNSVVIKSGSINSSDYFNDCCQEIINNFTASVNANITANLTSSLTSSIINNVYVDFSGDLTPSRRDVYRYRLTGSIAKNDEFLVDGLDTTGLNISNAIDIFWGSFLLEPIIDYEYGSTLNKIKFKIDIPSGDQLLFYVYGQKKISWSNKIL